MCVFVYGVVKTMVHVRYRPFSDGNLSTCPGDDPWSSGDDPYKRVRLYGSEEQIGVLGTLDVVGVGHQTGETE